MYLAVHRRPALRAWKTLIADPRFFERSPRLLTPPLINCFSVEPPITADLEARQLTLFDQTIDRRAVDAQIGCNVADS
jgi:hypothetical protein